VRRVAVRASGPVPHGQRSGRYALAATPHRPFRADRRTGNVPRSRPGSSPHGPAARAGRCAMTVIPDSPPEVSVPARQVREALSGARRVVFLDDDPTGTQAVRDLPVLTRWRLEDITWALQQDTPGFFVLTNTRSLDPQAAADRDREVVDVCLRAAETIDVQLA